MEDIIQILIFAGAMIIAAVGKSAKNKKNPENPSPEEVLKDMFPEIQVEREEPMKTPSVEPLRPKVRVMKPVSRPAEPPLRTSPLSTPDPTSPKPTQKVRITNREEARRAFIHSEIFNRKY